MSNSLRDIKPLVEVSDYSFILLLTTIVLSIFIAYKLFKLAYKYSIKNCSINCNKYYFYKYSSVDWNKPKEAAYLATKYGAVLAKDRRQKELYEQLRVRLDRYKYKKDIVTVDDETINYYNLYKQVCDESL